MVFGSNFAFVQRVAFLDEIKCFVRLDHKLFVSFSQVFSLDNYMRLLLELNIAAGSNDDPVLTWVVLLAFVLGLVQLFLKFQVFYCLPFQFVEIKWIEFVRGGSDLGIDEFHELLGTVVEFLLCLDFLLE